MKNCIGTILFFLGSLYVVREYTISIPSALAQINPDASLPQNSIVTTNGNVFDITGGSRVGNNLFHSFQAFSLPTSSTAFFNNPIDIQNILTRVTGTSISYIDGILKTNGTANLFLINPNGIIFGANARLAIGGSFVASTASSINFADGIQFSAINPQPSALLTVSIPLGLQMGGNPQPIAVLGNGEGLRTNSNLIDTLVGMRVGSSQTLALVGGDLAIVGGTLKTAGGNIELSSLGSFSQVKLNPTNQGLTLSYDPATIFQDIRLTNKASVDASGLGSGNIQVRGRNVSLTGGSQIQSSTLGNQIGGLLSIKASENLEISGLSLDQRFASGLISEVKANATGNGGNLIVEATNFSLKDGATISADNRGNGSGGNLTIKTSETIEAINSFINATIRLRAEGKGGNINIETAKIYLQGAQISADVQGKGDGGSITVKISDSIEAVGFTSDNRGPSGFVISVGRSGEGKSGDLLIETAKLTLRDGAAISSSTFGKGDAGSITLKASDSITISGRSLSEDRPSALVALVTPTAQGIGGNITIETDRLVVNRGASISVSDLAGVKGAGNIQITSDFILLDASTVTASTAAGVQGNIFLNTSNLQMFNNSQIQANAFGLATGGNIKIITDTLVAFGNSDITANAQQASGGRVIINAAGIFGTAFRRAITPKSDITASSELGAEFSGVVQLNIIEADPSRALSRVPVGIEDSSRLIVQGCQADANQSKFTITGKGGLPTSPNQVIMDSSTHDILGVSEPAVTSSLQSFNALPESKPEVVEADNWVMTPNGDIVLIANSPNTTLISTINSLKSCRH